MTDPDIVIRLRESDGGYFMRQMFTEAADEIERLRDEIDRKNLTIQALTEKRDEVVCGDLALQEIARLRKERDEVRQSYCSLMEAYRGGDGRVTANKLGWGYLFEETRHVQ